MSLDETTDDLNVRHAEPGCDFCVTCGSEVPNEELTETRNGPVCLDCRKDDDAVKNLAFSCWIEYVEVVK